MKNFINAMISGNNSISGGVVAIAVIAAIGLGCFCNKDKMSSVTNTTTTPSSSSPTPQASPSAEPTKNFKKADASKSEIPSDDELQEIVKKTMLDFNDALQQEDFTDFHGTISKVWQKQTTPESLKSSFQSFIDGEADFGNIRSMTATFKSPAEITRSTGVKTLETKGEYATTPNATEFELKYIAEKKDWKLIGIRVYTNVKIK